MRFFREKYRNTYLYVWRQLGKKIYLLKKEMKKEMKKDLIKILHLRRRSETDKD